MHDLTILHVTTLVSYHTTTSPSQSTKLVM